jgi:hypothetical protein
MNQVLPAGTLIKTRSFVHSYLALTALAIAAPAVLVIYAIAAWGLTSDLGLTEAFPWTVGPLSNWMIWLGLALLSNLVLVVSTRQRITVK